MANKAPSYRRPTLFPGKDGRAVKTKRVVVPIDLVEEILAYAAELHARRLADSKAPRN